MTSKRTFLRPGEFVGWAGPERLANDARSQPATEGLESLRELSEKATPGEWFWDSYSAILAPAKGEEPLQVIPFPHPTRGDVTTQQGGYDARFIIAAVNFVRAALAATDPAE